MLFGMGSKREVARVGFPCRPPTEKKKKQVYRHHVKWWNFINEELSKNGGYDEWCPKPDDDKEPLIIYRTKMKKKFKVIKIQEFL
jgi:hypothetical protein